MVECSKGRNPQDKTKNRILDKQNYHKKGFGTKKDSREPIKKIAVTGANFAQKLGEKRPKSSPILGDCLTMG